MSGYWLLLLAIPVVFYVVATAVIEVAWHRQNSNQERKP